MLRSLRLLLLLAALAFALPVDAGLLKSLFKPAVRAGADIALSLPTTRVTARPSIHILVPQDDAGYLRMFGRSRTGLMAEQMRLANDALAGVDASFVSSMEDLNHALGSSDSNAVYLVAHSEDKGKSIALPSGARVEIRVLEDQCMAMGKVCIVLSCHSPHLGLTREIEYTHAVLAAAKSAKAWKGMPAPTTTRSRKGLHDSAKPGRLADPEAPSTVAELANYAADQLNRLSPGSVRRFNPFKSLPISSSVVLVAAVAVGKTKGARN